MTVAEIEAWAGRPLPGEYRQFLEAFGGEFVTECVVVYAPEDVVERNETFQVKEYCPGHITIGDDSGGKAIVIATDKDPCPVYIVGHGCMDTEYFHFVASSLSEWRKANYEIPD